MSHLHYLLDYRNTMEEDIMSRKRRRDHVTESHQDAILDKEQFQVLAATTPATKKPLPKDKKDDYVLDHLMDEE